MQKLNQNDAMALAYYGYPDSRDKLEALQDDPNLSLKEHPTFNMPNGWGFFDESRIIDLNLPKEFNKYRNKDGDVTNQFELLINPLTKEIVISFKGSVELENWVSDIRDSGGREFKKIMEKADDALAALLNDDLYKDYNISTAGHSLGGGMAQTFALKHNLDASVYNSLPISAYIATNTNYFNTEKNIGAEAFKEHVDNYRAIDHRVHDVRTANDIASMSFAYKYLIPHSTAKYLSVNKMHRDFNGYLTDDPTILPGASMPSIVQVLTLPIAAPVMGVDHMIRSLRDATMGLVIDQETGKYIIPNGHYNLSLLDKTTRVVIESLDNSPIQEVLRKDGGGTSDNITTLVREQSTQEINADKKGNVQIREVDKHGTMTADIHYNHFQVSRALREGIEAPITINNGEGLTIRNTQETFQNKSTVTVTEKVQTELYIPKDKNELPTIGNQKLYLNGYTASVAIHLAQTSKDNVQHISVWQDRIGEREEYRNIYDIQYGNGVKQNIIEFPNKRDAAYIHQFGNSGEYIQAEG